MPARDAASKINRNYYSWKEQAVDQPYPPIDILNIISNKWSFLILATLAPRPYRFGELLRDLPNISQRMLTQTLTDLHRDGLINRVVFPTKPPSVEYSLTPLGVSLMLPLWELVKWVEDHHPKIIRSRKGFDREQK